MEYLPSLVEHTTGPVSGLGCPSTLMLAEPGAGAAAAAGLAGAASVVDVLEVLVVAGELDVLSLLEPPSFRNNPPTRRARSRRRRRWSAMRSSSNSPSRKPAGLNADQNRSRRGSGRRAESATRKPMRRNRCRAHPAYHSSTATRGLWTGTSRRYLLAATAEGLEPPRAPLTGLDHRGHDGQMPELDFVRRLAVLTGPLITAPFLGRLGVFSAPLFSRTLKEVEATMTEQPPGGYPPPPPPQGGGYPPPPGGQPAQPSNHLAWSILSTLFCCLRSASSRS